MAKFALELHPDKTRLIAFGQRAAAARAARGEGKPETFDFLGFTHICARTRRGGFLLARHTRRDRKRAKLREITEDLRRRWHQDTAEQGRWLGAVVRGYPRVRPGGMLRLPCRALQRACPLGVPPPCHRSLAMRPAPARPEGQDVMDRLANRWLPKPRISHPWPAQRFRVKHPRSEPYAGMPHVRFCAGGAQ